MKCLAVFVCLFGLALSMPANGGGTPDETPPTTENPPTAPECLLGDNPTNKQRSDAIYDLVDRLKRIGESVKRMRAIGIQQITKLADLITSSPCLDNSTAPVIPEPVATSEMPAAPTVALLPAVIDAQINALCKAVSGMEQGIVRMKHIGLTNIDKMARFVELTDGQICPAV